MTSISAKRPRIKVKMAIRVTQITVRPIIKGVF